jgi:Tol biopolymer transport system component
VAAVALVVGAAVTWLVLPAGADPSETNPLHGATITKLTDSPARELGATISSNGAYVAYASDREGPFDAFVRQLGTWDDVNITRGTKDWWGLRVFDLGFEPDNTRIWVSSTMDREPMSSTVRGADTRAHTEKGIHETTYSPDGKRMVYHTHEPGDPVFVADEDGSHPQQILVGKHGEHHHYPVWGTRGEWIYMSRGWPVTAEMALFRMRPVPDGELQQLTTDKIDVSHPAPIDERTVLYLAKTPSGAGPWLWSLDLESGVSTRVLTGVERFTSLAASTDGRRLVATVSNPRAQLARVPVLDGQLATEADVEVIPGLDEIPGERPRVHGDDVYFISSQGAGDGLWCLREGGPTELLAGKEVVVLASPSVSPDGTRIAVVVRKQGEVGLWLYDRGGKSQRFLSKDMTVYGEPAWAPDGRSVAVGGIEGGRTGLFLVPVDGGPRELLVEDFAISPTWSSDGELIAYLGRTVMAFHEVGAIELATRKPISVTTEARVRVGEPIRFLPGGRRLVFMYGTLHNRDFFAVDLDEADPTVRRITRLGSPTFSTSFDVTPDGSHIVFDRVEPNSDVILIERQAPEPE